MLRRLQPKRRFCFIVILAYASAFTALDKSCFGKPYFVCKSLCAQRSFQYSILITGWKSVYPSVYVRYSGIRAWDGCGYKNERLDEAFVGFDPSKVSSVLEWVAPDVWLNATGYPSFYSRKFTTVPLTYPDLQEPCGSTIRNEFGTQTRAVGITTIIGGSTFTDYDRCQPTLYINDVVSELAPGWVDCKPVSYGVWDPPRTLTPVGQLGITSQAPAPSDAPDPLPQKTSHSQAVASTSAPTGSQASSGPSPGPSSDPSPGHSPDPPDPSPHSSPSISPVPAQNPSPGPSPSSPDPPQESPPENSPNPSTGPAPASSPDTKQPVPTAQPAGRTRNGSLVPLATFIDPSPPTSTPLATPSNPSVPKQPVPIPGSLSKGTAGLGPDTSTPDRPALTFTTHEADVAALITIGSATVPITILPSGAGVIISAHTLAPNDPAVTVVADIPVSLALAHHSGPAGSASLNLIVGSSTIDLTPLASIPISTDSAADPLLHQSLLSGSWPVPELGTLTLVSGGSTVKVIKGAVPVTLAGHPVSLASGALLAVGTHTATIGTIPQNGVITAWDLPATVIRPSAVTISGAIISAGAPAVTIAGQLVSLGASGLLAVGTNTANLPTALFTIEQGPVVTVGGQVATAINPSEVLIGGKTVSAGGSAVSIASQIVSLGTDGVLAVGTNTATVPKAPFDIDQDPVITVGGHIAAAINPSEAIIDGKTISAGGPALTLAGGEVVSAAGTNAPVVMSANITRTEKIAGHIPSTLGLGGLILGAFGGSVPGGPGTRSGSGAQPTGTTVNGSGMAIFTGATVKRATESIMCLQAIMMLVILRQAFG